MTRKNIPALTGIRGVAALLVVMFHMHLNNTLPLISGWTIIHNGFFGVDLFFILSGFILMHVHANDFVRIDHIHLKSFFITRFFRIYPLHFVTVLASFCFVMIFPAYITWFRTLGGQANAFSWPGLVQTLTLTNGIGMNDLGSWNPASWSISSELVGYLAFPVLACIAARIRDYRLCLLAAVLGLSLDCANQLTIHMGSQVFRMAFCFTTGVALARAYHLRPEIDGRALAAISAAFAVLTLSFDSTSEFSIFGFAGLIYALALGGGAVESFFASRVSMFLGKISFSLYLAHFLVQTTMLWLFWDGDGSRGILAITFATLLAATFATAILLYYVVERPSHALGRALARRKELVAADRALAAARVA